MIDLELLDSINVDPLNIIYTSSMEYIETGMEWWLVEPEPSILLILGKYGIGKTIIITYIVQRFDPRPHTGLRPIEIVTIPEHATRASLPQTILEYFGERPKGNSPALVKQVIKFLDDNEIRVLILDEGDRFIRDSFEVLKDFHDASVRRELKCRFAIAGLPELLDLITEHGQFGSRAPSVLVVEPLSDEEIINKFLPNLTIPRWRFNPADRIDQELATPMWQRTTPTLRLLIAWISKASGLAKLRGKDWVTIEEVGDAAVVLFFGKADKKKLELSEGIHERISELRNAFKALKNAGK